MENLFQFTNPTDQENTQLTPYSENIYFTDNQEYMEKIKGMLNDVWKTASAPSAVTLESIFTPSAVTDAASGSGIATAEMMKKNDQARLSAKSGWRGNVTLGMAVIHPPSYHNMLDMMIHVQKSEKESAFGASGTLIFCLCLRPPPRVWHAVLLQPLLQSFLARFSN